MLFCNIELSKTAPANEVRGIKIRGSGKINSWRGEDESNPFAALLLGQSSKTWYLWDSFTCGDSTVLPTALKPDFFSSFCSKVPQVQPWWRYDTLTTERERMTPHFPPTPSLFLFSLTATVSLRIENEISVWFVVWSLQCAYARGGGERVHKEVNQELCTVIPFTSCHLFFLFSSFA